MSDEELVQNIILAYIRDRHYVEEAKLLLHTERAFQDVFGRRSTVEAVEVLDKLVETEAVCYIQYKALEKKASTLYFIGGTVFTGTNCCNH